MTACPRNNYYSTLIVSGIAQLLRKQAGDKRLPQRRKTLVLASPLLQPSPQLGSNDMRSPTPEKQSSRKMQPLFCSPHPSGCPYDIHHFSSCLCIMKDATQWILALAVIWRFSSKLSHFIGRCKIIASTRLWDALVRGWLEFRPVLAWFNDRRFHKAGVDVGTLAPRDRRGCVSHNLTLKSGWPWMVW